MFLDGIHDELGDMFSDFFVGLSTKVNGFQIASSRETVSFSAQLTF